MDSFSFVILLANMFLCGALVGLNMTTLLRGDLAGINAVLNGVVCIATLALVVLIGYVGVYVNKTRRDY